MDSAVAKKHWLNDILPQEGDYRQKYIDLRARIEKAAHNVESTTEGGNFGTGPDADNLDYLISYIDWLEER